MNTANKRQLFRIGNAWDFHEIGGRLESYDMLSINCHFSSGLWRRCSSVGGEVKSHSWCVWRVDWCPAPMGVPGWYLQWQCWYQGSSSSGDSAIPEVGIFILWNRNECNCHQLKGLIFFKLENWWNFAQNQMCIYNWSFAEGLIYPSFRDLPFWRVKDISNFCRHSG